MGFGSGEALILYFGALTGEKPKNQAVKPPDFWCFFEKKGFILRQQRHLPERIPRAWL
jgi:hypothetical protein